MFADCAREAGEGELANWSVHSLFMLQQRFIDQLIYYVCITHTRVGINEHWANVYRTSTKQWMLCFGAKNIKFQLIHSPFNVNCPMVCATYNYHIVWLVCTVLALLCASMCQSYMPQNIDDKWIMASSVGTAFCADWFTCFYYYPSLLKHHRTIYCTPANKFTLQFMHAYCNRLSNLIQFYQYCYVCQKIEIFVISDIYVELIWFASMVNKYGNSMVYLSSVFFLAALIALLELESI